MPYFPKVALIALIAFLIPVGVVTTLHWDSVQRYVHVSPQDAKGYVLYFTTYG